MDIRVIQVLLGHAKLDNNALYTRVASKIVRTVTSPLDKITAQWSWTTSTANHVEHVIEYSLSSTEVETSRSL